MVEEFPEIRFICNMINGPTDPEILMEDLMHFAWTESQVIEGLQRALERGHIWLNSGGYVELNRPVDMAFT